MWYSIKKGTVKMEEPFHEKKSRTMSGRCRIGHDRW